MTGTFALAWFVAVGVLFVWALFAWALSFTDRHAAAPAAEPAVHRLPPATMRLVLVTPGRRDVVVDGLLDFEGATVGVPTTWTLELPGDTVFRDATIAALERWAGDDADIAIDLSKLAGNRPSVQLARDDTRVRLDLSDAA